MLDDVQEPAAVRVPAAQRIRAEATSCFRLPRGNGPGIACSTISCKCAPAFIGSPRADVLQRSTPDHPGSSTSRRELAHRTTTTSSSSTATSSTAAARRAYRADVGIRGDTIAAIGDLSKRTAAIDASTRRTGRHPGFIDLLGHSEGAVLIDPNLEAKDPAGRDHGGDRRRAFARADQRRDGGGGQSHASRPASRRDVALARRLHARDREARLRDQLRVLHRRRESARDRHRRRRPRADAGRAEADGGASSIRRCATARSASRRR